MNKNGAWLLSKLFGQETQTFMILTIYGTILYGTHVQMVIQTNSLLQSIKT